MCGIILCRGNKSSGAVSDGSGQVLGPVDFNACIQCLCERYQGRYVHYIRGKGHTITCGGRIEVGNGIAFPVKPSFI